MTNPQKTARIAFFISAHGFGHAARESAIIDEILKRRPDWVIDIFSEIPEWFFRESISARCNTIPYQNDVGLVQKTPFEMDLAETLSRLIHYFETFDKEAEKLSVTLSANQYNLIVSDISPIAIQAAKHSGIPVVLFENFTWDWIYEPFTNDYPQFSPLIERLRQIYARTDYHGQLIPFCKPEANADLLIPPVSRKTKTKRQAVRRRLSIDENHKMGLIALEGFLLILTA